MTLPHARATAIAAALAAAAAVSCTRHEAPLRTSTVPATVASPTAGTQDGRVTVRIAWRGRTEPPRAAQIKPGPAGGADRLEVTLEAPDPQSSTPDDSQSDESGDACQALPAELRTRTFSATIADAPPSDDPMSVFAASRSGPPLSTPYRTVVVEGPTIQEQLSPTTFLAIDGSGARSLASANPAAVTMPWSGDFETCELRSPGESDLGCGARPDQIVKRTVCHFSNGLLTIRRR